MRDKLKKLLRNLDLIEEVVIKMISIAGWILILIKVIRGAS